MLLLLITGSISLFLSFNIGYFINKLLRGSLNYTVPLFEILLTGTATITVYLNLLSLFFPTNYLLLIPLVLASLLICFKTDFLRDTKEKLKHVSPILFHKSNRVATISLLVVILFFIIVPPFNTDMGGYHILSILWNEKFAVVPGLANLFAQFGFNSSFFVLSAAFSFTDIFNQSIYAVNMVLIPAFYGWMLVKSFSYNDWRKPLIWMLLSFFFRQFLINLSAPSPDALFMILVFYILFQLTEKTKDSWKEGESITLVALAIFAVTIKISAVPILLIVFLPLLYKTSRKQKRNWFLKLAGLATLIIIPWLIRNVIISGYLAFPVPLDIFAFDWKVPMTILIEEKQHISNAPRMISPNFSYVDQLPITTKFILWLPRLWNDSRINFVLIILAFLSPVFAWLTFKKTSFNNLGIWAWVISYAGVLFWFVGSPDIRFGFPYLISALCLPLFFIAAKRVVHSKQITWVFVLLVSGCSIYYVYKGAGMMSGYNIAQWIFKPIKHPEYQKNNDLNTFRYVLLNDSIKLYIHDAQHHTINAPLPGCAPYRDGIRMRGRTLQEGFKMIHK